MPTARGRIGSSTRAACCAHDDCSFCPIGAKFTIPGQMNHVFHDPRVTLRLDSEVQRVVFAGGVAVGVEHTSSSQEHYDAGEVVALGANALFNPAILLRSGVEHPVLGRGLCEQVGFRGTVYTAGIDGFDGSTSLTGHGYMLYAGEHRRSRAACLIETNNAVAFRLEFGRWRQKLGFKAICEDLPRDTNFIDLTAAGKPRTVYEGPSDYTKRSIADLQSRLERVFARLPVERLDLATEPAPSEAHIVGTTRMGDDPAQAFVTPDLKMHGCHNLLVLGSGSFPTCPPANPTLTLCALSLRAAARL